MIKKDSDLVSVEEITNRIQSIDRQREKLNDTQCRSNHHTAFEAKNKKIRKLTEREGKLRILLHELLTWMIIYKKR